MQPLCLGLHVGVRLHPFINRLFERLWQHQPKLISFPECLCINMITMMMMMMMVMLMMMMMTMMMMMDKAPPSPCPPGHCKRPSCASQRSPHRPYVRDAPAMAPRGRTPSVCGDHPVYNRIRHPDCSMNLITPQSSTRCSKHYLSRKKISTR